MYRSLVTHLLFILCGTLICVVFLPPDLLQSLRELRHLHKDEFESESEYEYEVEYAYERMPESLESFGSYSNESEVSGIKGKMKMLWSTPVMEVDMSTVGIDTSLLNELLRDVILKHYRGFFTHHSHHLTYESAKANNANQLFYEWQTKKGEFCYVLHTQTQKFSLHNRNGISHQLSPCFHTTFSLHTSSCRLLSHIYRSLRRQNSLTRSNTLPCMGNHTSPQCFSPPPHTPRATHLGCVLRLCTCRRLW
jgi:sensor histidine kinase YesM